MFESLWGQLQERDQRIVTIGAVLVVLLLGFVWVWMPIATGFSTAVSTLENNIQVLRQVSRDAVGIQAIKAQGYHYVPENQKPVLAQVQTELKSSGLSRFVLSVTQTNKQAAVVSFTKVPFDELLLWLNTVAKQKGLFVTGATINVTPVSGLVNATLQFSA